MKRSTMLAIGAGVAGVATVGAVVVAARRKVSPMRLPPPMPGAVSKAARIKPERIPVALPLDYLMLPQGKPKGVGPGYRLVDAVAMAETVLSWAETGNQPGSVQYSGVVAVTLAAVRAELASWAGAGAPGFSEGARVRGIVYSVIMRLLASEGASLMPWYFPHQTTLTKARLSAVGTWVGMYLVGTQTGAVLLPEHRRMLEGWLHPLPHSGWDWRIYADEFWEPASIADQKYALIQLFWRIMIGIAHSCEGGGDEVCAIATQAISDINNIERDEVSLGNTPEVIAAGNLARVQMLASAPARTFFLLAVIPPYDIVGKLVTAVCTIAAAVVGMPQVGAAMGTTIAAAIGVALKVVKLGQQVAAAIKSGSGLDQLLVQAAINSGVVEAIQTEASMFLPETVKDYTGAAVTGLDRAAAIIAKAKQGSQSPW